MNEELRQAAREHLIRYGGDTFPNLFNEAKGCILRDDTGREILDFTSGQMCATIGHNHPNIVKVLEFYQNDKYFFIFIRRTYMNCFLLT